ncbi:MAG: hypothetical protein JSS79_12150 [Bacteroidetes bacterium]|nr:hypothetical protein [Bacteroidota bacterium]
MKKLKQVSLLLASITLLAFSIFFSRPASADNFNHQTSIDQVVSLAEDDLDESIHADQFLPGDYLPLCIWVINSDQSLKPQFTATVFTRVSPLPFYLQINTLRI